MAHEGDGHENALPNAQILTKRLFDGIRVNNIEQVRICINQGGDLQLLKEIYSVEDDGTHSYDDVCPLVYAVCLGHEEIMKELLKAGADPNQFSGRFHLPVNSTTNQPGITLSMIKSLVSYGTDITLRDPATGWSLLHHLASYGMQDPVALLSAANLLLDNGASFYALDHGHRTPLHCACRSRNIDLVKLFLAEGADLNFGNCELLEEAAASCNIGMFDYLLDFFSNRYICSSALARPCYLNNYTMIVRILDKCVVDINMAMDLIGINILEFACKDNHISSKMAKLLLDRGADVRAVSVSGDTALHYAVNNCDCSKIRQLLSYNPPLDIRNNSNQTPLSNVVRIYRGGLRCQVRLLTFKMIVVADANYIADFEHELNQFFPKYPVVDKSDYEISSIRSLKEMCRLVIRHAIPVPVDGNLCKLPIPELLQIYLNFPEYDPLIEDYFKYLSGH